MDRSTIMSTIQQQRDFFESGKTRGVQFRLSQLAALKGAVERNEDALCEALKRDLNKPRFEAYLGEIAVLIKEIDYAMRKLRRWMKPKRVFTPLIHFPAAGYVYSEPLGVVLIIGPWNYPVQLILAPLVGALAAGNCAVLKPSELAPHTSALIAGIIREAFDPAVVAGVEGGVEAATALLDQQFAHIFFTGGTAVGRVVAQAAAKNLIPTTLELGGKSPCIVDRDVDLQCAAKRIVWGKFFNAGQTCVAPDYLLAHADIKTKLLDLLKSGIKEFYGEDPKQSPDYARIVNARHFERLVELLGEGDVIAGGQTDPADNYIAPTVIDNISPDYKIMQSEIFGPILPVIEYHDLTQAVSFVNRLPRPLALYFFSTNKQKQDSVLAQTSFGGGTMNDTLIHCATAQLPFGGVGDSGLGRYHGKASFDTFSHKKSVIKRWLVLDVDLRYPPYGNKLPLLKRLVGWFG
ncbi:MAG: aldehyde dehydrogenase [Desulfomonile tiedjei]|nr:aldehyde dehydrogenase [Desulfomonile tiedjei]